MKFEYRTCFRAERPNVTNAGSYEKVLLCASRPRSVRKFQRNEQSYYGEQSGRGCLPCLSLGRKHDSGAPDSFWRLRYRPLAGSRLARSRP